MPVVISLLLLFSRCSYNNGTSKVLSAHLTLANYAEVREKAANTARTTFSFPLLEIYNSSGFLVYRGEDSATNSGILREFPAQAKNLKPQATSQSLRSILQEIPEFKPEMRRILSSGKFVILSVDLQDCQACTLQENALDDQRKSLLRDYGATILELHVERP